MQVNKSDMQVVKGTKKSLQYLSHTECRHIFIHHFFNRLHAFEISRCRESRIEIG